MIVLGFILTLNFSHAQDVPAKSLHWKFVRESLDDRWDGEVWFSVGKERVENRYSSGVTETIIVADGKTYRWRTKDGKIESATVTDASHTLTVSIFKRLAKAKAEGKRVGNETVDGVACEKWSWFHPVYVQTYLWLTKDSPLPIKQTDTAPGVATDKPDTMTETIRDLEVDKPVDPARFVPPKEITFR